MSVLLLILSGIVVLLAIVSIIFIMRSFFLTLSVRKHGIHILATVTKIDREYVSSIGRGYTISYFVRADWKDPETGAVYHFKSYAGGASLPINHPPGSSIDVLIDPRNPRRYEVQLRFEDRSFV
jgi:hypothetical protein